MPKSSKPKNKAGGAVTFIKEVRIELSKVVWPTRQETIKLTLIVLVSSIFISSYIGLLDLGFTKLVSLILGN